MNTSESDEQVPELGRRASARRIVCVVTQAERAGAQGAAIRLARELRGRGYDAQTWFLYRKRDAFVDEPHTHVLFDGRPSGIVGATKLLMRLMRSLKGFRPDAVYSFTHYANAVVQPVAWICGVRRRVASERSVYHVQPRVARLATAILGRIGCYTSIIAVSQTVRESFSDHPKSFQSRMVTVPNGIDVLRSPLSQQLARSRLGFLPDRPLMVSVGRLATVKNHDVLIQALTQMPGWHLALVGWGERSGELRRLAENIGVSERVTFLGDVEPQTVADALRAADVFGFPSLSEAFGFAALEAAGNCVPIVGSDIPALRELFGSAREGDAPAAILVDPQDPDGFARGALSIWNDETLRQRLVAKALAVAEKHPLRSMIDGYEALLNEDHAQRGPPPPGRKGVKAHE